MRNLLRYTARSRRSILLIVCILFIQAFCDLSLPGYTSDIVNVGIQQGGITQYVPQQIRKSDLDKLITLMPEKDRQTAADAYTVEEGQKQETDPVYRLRDTDKETTDKLEDILRFPMLAVTAMDQMKEEQGENTEQANPATPGPAEVADPASAQAGQAAAAQMAQMMEEVKKQADALPESITKQAQIAYVRQAYERAGVDTDRIQTNYLLKTGALMTALAFLGMAASVLVGFLASRVGAGTGRYLREKVFKKVVGYSNYEFDTFSTASLITRSTNDVQQVQLTVVMLLRIILYAPILAIGGIYKVFHTNVSMSWIIALAIGLIGLVILLLLFVAMPRFKKLQLLVDRMNLVTREFLTGLPVIRAFGTQKYEEEKFDRANKDLTGTNLFVNRAMTFMMPVMMLIMNGISVLIIWTGAHGINDGSMQVGDMMAFIQYTMQIIMSFLMLCILSIIMPRSAVAADRIEEVMNSRTKIEDPKQPAQPEKREGVLTFDHVDFRYPGAKENVLDDISFTVRPGETTAIIGSTGSGKSTLLHLIPRFYDVSGGSICLDGVDIREMRQKDLREEIGFVPQKGVLFSGTIASNILFGKKGTSEELTEEENKLAEEAAQIAQAEEFISDKPQGYMTTVSQGGTNVSGGQKQRLSIARAIAKDPLIYLFDDSFSALDYKTDVALRKGLAKKTKDRSVVIVAQRISTIIDADQIIVLDEGRVAGIGSHSELMNNCEVYRQIASSQMSEEELAKWESRKEKP